jgi:hypothetical protein
LVRGAHPTRLEKTPIGSILNKLGNYVPDPIWKVASATFAGNASKEAIKVGVAEGRIWSIIEKPILNWRKIPIRLIP